MLDTLNTATTTPNAEAPANQRLKKFAWATALLLTLFIVLPLLNNWQGKTSKQTFSPTIHLAANETVSNKLAGLKALTITFQNGQTYQAKLNEKQQATFKNIPLKLSGLPISINIISNEAYVLQYDSLQTIKEGETLNINIVFKEELNMMGPPEPGLARGIQADSSLEPKSVTPTPTANTRYYQFQSTLDLNWNLLKKPLEAATNWQYNVHKEDLEVSINFTEQILPTDKEAVYFYYPGGYLDVKLNGITCCCLEEERFKIAKTNKQMGNKKHLLEQKLQEKIQLLIEENTPYLIQKIKPCLD